MDPVEDLQALLQVNSWFSLKAGSDRGAAIPSELGFTRTVVSSSNLLLPWPGGADRPLVLASGAVELPPLPSPKRRCAIFTPGLFLNICELVVLSRVRLTGPFCVAWCESNCCSQTCN